MPNYLYKCVKCGAEDYEIRTVDKRNEPKECKSTMLLRNPPIPCGGEMKLKIGNPPFKIKG